MIIYKNNSMQYVIKMFILIISSVKFSNHDF